MAKRFTDTDKWKKKWFRSLSNDQKVFWQFILDNCNHAGIWDVDFEYASIFCGPLNEKEIREVFIKQYRELDGGKRWLIADFNDFQYGELNPNNNAHKSVLNILEKAGAHEPLKSPSGGAKDKDQEQDKDKEKGGMGGKVVKERFFDHVFLTPEEHEKLIQRLGPEKTADYIERLNNYIGSKGAKYKSHYHTILTWSSKDGPPGVTQEQAELASKFPVLAEKKPYVPRHRN
ncbi:MAG TPA: hypothetical protein V6D12_14320 [Candidatus Obscuribacterales bacterium]